MESDEHTREAEDLTALLRVWPDVETALLDDPDLADLADAVRRAFRIEASPTYSGGEYRLFDVESAEGRQAAALVESHCRCCRPATRAIGIALA